MTDTVIAWLRTIFPALWSTVIVLGVARGLLPTEVADALTPAGEAVLLPVVLAVVYPVLRTVEEKLPSWLRVILMGSNQTPQYHRE